jgi:hypothetical protein
MGRHDCSVRVKREENEEAIRKPEEVDTLLPVQPVMRMRRRGDFDSEGQLESEVALVVGSKVAGEVAGVVAWA